MLFRSPPPVGKLPTKGVETPQKPLAQGFVTRAGRPSFERIDGVSHIRLEEMDPEVAAMKPDFPQQRVTGESSVESGDLFHGCLDRFGAGVPWIQLVRAEIVVHMPDARAVGVGDAACQRRPQVAQTDGGQPAFDRLFDSPGGRGTQSFGDQRERLAVDGESEAEHAPGLRLQLGVAEIPSLDGGSSEQLLDQSAEFGHAWLPTTIQELVEALNHGLHLAIAGSSPPGTTQRARLPRTEPSWPIMLSMGLSVYPDEVSLCSDVAVIS